MTDKSIISQYDDLLAIERHSMTEKDQYDDLFTIERTSCSSPQEIMIRNRCPEPRYRQSAANLVS